MQISTFRDRVSRALVDFAWNEWSQMGVLAETRRDSHWAADPEALLLLSFQVGRADPRLFDEVLDWLALNVGSLSLQRLRNHYDDKFDQAIGEAALAWAREQGARVRVLEPRPVFGVEGEQLFYGRRKPQRPDPVFSAYGLLRPSARRSGKSQRPDPLRAINFAFRLRQTFGVGSRAEIMRFLLTASVRSPTGAQPLFTTLAIAEAAGYAKRNVHEALNALVEAQVIQVITRGNERLYRVDPSDWTGVMGGPLPSYRDWPNAFYALRLLHRWVCDDHLSALTPYLLASEARQQMEHIAPALKAAGLHVWERQVHGAEYWDVFVEAINQVLAEIEGGLPW